MITKENLIGAYFIDDDRKNIEVLTTSEDKKQIIPFILPFDENNNVILDTYINNSNILLLYLE